MVATHPQCCHIKDRGRKLSSMLVTRPHHHTVPVCLLAPFLSVHSCFPHQWLTTYSTLAWVPIELSSCSNCG